MSNNTDNNNNNSTPINQLSNDDNTEISDIINKIEIDNQQIESNQQTNNNQNFDNNQKFNNNQQVNKENTLEKQDDNEKVSYFDILFYELLPSIISLILFFILSLDNVDNILGNYLQFMLNDENKLTYLGILLKSVIFSVILYTINKFII
mgnify:CR=1 FL=1